MNQRVASAMASVDVLAEINLITQLLLVGTVILFTVSGLDDLIIDIYYLCRQLYVLLWVRPRYPRLRAEQLSTVPEQPIAIIVPAWQESAVIEHMLANTIRTLDYSNFVIFVGTYPNDADTQLAVERAREHFPNVERTVCPHDGPTSKADCLNWIVQGIRHHEQQTGVTFQIFVMQDAEDVVHPLSLRLYNYLMPRFSMIQTPVFSLPRRLTEFTAGVYIDEFAELHTKDLVVRERLGHNVPSAGVGTAFSREAVDKLAEENQNQLFRLDSLTEDYDFGFRLGECGLKQIFVRFPIEREVERTSIWTGKKRKVLVRDYIATREFFPNQFWPSVRQKTRWVIGIALQGWAHLGWRGDWRRKYILFRDRKILLTSNVNILGYLVVLMVLAFWLYQVIVPDAYVFSPLAGLDEWVLGLLILNGAFFLLRLTQRFLTVAHLYGVRQGMMSAPRLVWGNMIMFLACWRAMFQFSKWLRTGERIAWDKTDHAFPSEAQLTRFRRRIGDLMLERRFVTVDGLSRALEEQKRTGQPLGAVLVGLGLAREEEVLEVLGAQLRLAVRDVDPYAVPEDVLARLPAETARRYGVFPIDASDGSLEVATDRLLSREELDAIQKSAGMPVKLALASRAEIGFALRRRYGGAADRRPGYDAPLLGERLVEAGLITREQLEETLREQRRRFRRLGDIIVEKGWLERERLETASAEAAAAGRTLGQHLLEVGSISETQLAEALQHQEASDRRLGELLVEKDLLTRDKLDDVLRPPSG